MSKKLIDKKVRNFERAKAKEERKELDEPNVGKVGDVYDWSKATIVEISLMPDGSLEPTWSVPLVKKATE